MSPATFKWSALACHVVVRRQAWPSVFWKSGELNMVTDDGQTVTMTFH